MVERKRRGAKIENLEKYLGSTFYNYVTLLNLKTSEFNVIFFVSIDWASAKLILRSSVILKA